MRSWPKDNKIKFSYRSSSHGSSAQCESPTCDGRLGWPCPQFPCRYHGQFGSHLPCEWEESEGCAFHGAPWTSESSWEHDEHLRERRSGPFGSCGEKRRQLQKEHSQHKIMNKSKCYKTISTFVTVLSKISSLPTQKLNALPTCVELHGHRRKRREKRKGAFMQSSTARGAWNIS